MGIRHRIVIIVRMHTSTATNRTSPTRDHRTPCRHCEGLGQGKNERCHFCGRWLLKVAELVS